MTRSVEEVMAHAEELARRFEEYEPDPADEVSPHSALFEVYADASGNYRWRLRAGNGQVVAASGEAYSTKAAAVRAAETVRAAARSADERPVRSA